MAVNRASLAKIHIAKKELRLSEEDYRAILVRVTTCASAANLTDVQAGRLLDEFRRLGWKPSAAGAHHRPRHGAGDARRAKAVALWLSLHQAGIVADGSDKALAAFIRRQTGQDIGRLDHARWTAVIEALKAWCGRVGVS